MDKNYTSSTLRAHCKARRLTPDAIDLLEKLLRLDPAQRIRTEEAMAHPYFTTDPQPMSRTEFRRAQYLPSHEFIVKGKDKRRQLDSSEHEPGTLPITYSVQLPISACTLSLGGGPVFPAGSLLSNSEPMQHEPAAPLC